MLIWLLTLTCPQTSHSSHDTGSTCCSVLPATSSSLCAADNRRKPATGALFASNFFSGVTRAARLKLADSSWMEIRSNRELRYYVWQSGMI